MKHRAIAIDGPAASGKSSVAKLLAKRLGLIMVNSGAMYRAVTYQTLQHGINPNNTLAVIDLLESHPLKCGISDQTSSVGIEGRTLGDELSHSSVNQAVSTIAAIPEVRSTLVALQRAYLKTHDLVMEGRDIGSVVFPDTPFKLFITASEEVREKRRQAEGISDPISVRDANDQRRSSSPLVIPEGAVEIDSSDLNLEETVEMANKVLTDLGWGSQGSL